MAHLMCESNPRLLRGDFDRRLKLEFHGSKVTTDAGLLAYRELGDALGLTEMIGDVLADIRTGKNGRHGMTGLFGQPVFGRLGGQPPHSSTVTRQSASSPTKPMTTMPCAACSMLWTH